MGVSWGNVGAPAVTSTATTWGNSPLPLPVVPVVRQRPLTEWCENDLPPGLRCKSRPEYVVTLRTAYTVRPGEKWRLVLLKPRLLCQGCTEAVMWLHASGTRSAFRVADIGLITEW